METIRQAVSDIVNEVKAYTLDDKISYRFLASRLQDRIETFLKQDAQDRTIFNMNELWKPIYGIGLSEVIYTVGSPYYDHYDQLVRSNTPIPETYVTKYGNLIKVLNVNKTIEFKQIKPYEYKDLKNREFLNKRIKYFWIEEKYLYFPDINSNTNDIYLQEVMAYGAFKDSQAADLFNHAVSSCYLPLDSVLLVPQYIIDIAKKDVINSMLQRTRVTTDENPNENSNQK